MKMKLSKTQKELYDALVSGDVVHYMQYMGSFNPNPYFFLSSNNKRVTKAALALIDKGLAKIYGGYNAKKLVLVGGSAARSAGAEEE